MQVGQLVLTERSQFFLGLARHPCAACEGQSLKGIFCQNEPIFCAAARVVWRRPIGCRRAGDKYVVLTERTQFRVGAHLEG
jgi:hypothetical protein